MDGEHHRWLRLGGPLGVQPSELAKPALVVFLAFFVTWRGRAINNPRYTLFPAALAVGLIIFAVVVADLGTAVVLGAAAMVVFFVAGLEWRYCVIVAAVAGLGVCVFIAKSLTGWAGWCAFSILISKLSPSSITGAASKPGPKTRCARTIRTTSCEQSKIAVGAGGVTGVGLMNGQQKLLYLPFAHTDFIYAVAGEELGLIGSCGVACGFVRDLLARAAGGASDHDDFGRYLALGVTVIVTSQAFINMSVVLGMMPTKGISLPMISYGGSSLLSTLALLGILMNVSEHAG